MGRKSSDQEQPRSIKYFDEVKAAQNEKISAVNSIKALRSDLLPGSHTVPASKNMFQRINFRLVMGLLIALMLLILIWYVLVGSGRPALEQKLVSLMPTRVNTLQQVNPSPFPAIDKPRDPSSTPSVIPTRQPTATPSPTQTARPTHTSTNTRTATLTRIPPTTTPLITPTPSIACRDATTITLSDVGKTFCVHGTVIEVIEKPDNFMVIFSHEKGSFYWVSYDLTWSQVELRTCYQVTGTIKQLASSPVLLFDYSNIPEECP